VPWEASPFTARRRSHRAARDHAYPLTQDDIAAVADTCGQTIRSHLDRLSEIDA
jgi:hypothetical protein